MESSPFSNLPLDLLIDILERVTGDGSFQYALTCRLWRQLGPLVQRTMAVRAGADMSEAALLRAMSSFPLLAALKLRPGSLSRLSAAFLARVGAQAPLLRSLEIHELAVSKGAKVSLNGLSSLFEALPKLHSFVIASGAPEDSLGFAIPGPLLFWRSIMDPPQPPSLLVDSLPSNIRDLTSLSQLCIKSTRLSSLPSALWDLPSLTELRIDLPLLEEVSGEVARLARLRKFRVHSTVLQSLPRQMTGLQGLEELHLKCPSLRQLPDALPQLGSLRTLDITGCFNLRGLPELLPQMTSLTALAVGHVAESAIASLATLPSLQALRLWSFLSLLPDDLCRCPRLRVLSLCKCPQLLTLPAKLGDLQTLEELYVDGCPLLCLPESIKDIQGLKTLSVKSCPNFAPPKGGLPSSVSLCVESCRTAHGSLGAFVFSGSAAADSAAHVPLAPLLRTFGRAPTGSHRART